MSTTQTKIIGPELPSKLNVNDINSLETFMLSGTSAVLSKTVSAPIERIKLLIQNQTEMLRQQKLLYPYNSIYECLMRTIDNEGMWSLWRGNIANCIRYFPLQALNFTFKEMIKNKLATHPVFGPHLLGKFEYNKIMNNKDLENNKHEFKVQNTLLAYVFIGGI